jgi:hypothetical protein
VSTKVVYVGGPIHGRVSRIDARRRYVAVEVPNRRQGLRFPNALYPEIICDYAHYEICGAVAIFTGIHPAADRP